MVYVYDGMECQLDTGLVEKWSGREGLTDRQQFDRAMDCIMVNARGRLGMEGTPVTAEVLGLAAEELIREEIGLTGGDV